MNKKMLTIITALLAVAAFAQEKPVVQPKPGMPALSGVQTNPTEEKQAMKEPPALNWEQTPVDMVLQAYGDQVGKTVLKDPGTPNATITLKSREGQKLTQEEYLEAIEVVLEMNGVHIEPYGEKFIRAVPRAKARKIVGMAVYMSMEDARKAEPKDGTVVSVRLKFDNIGTEEAQKALEGFKSDSGLLQVFERTQSILVTDTWENIQRMDEILKSIDKGIEVKEKVHFRPIKYANVNDIKTVLEAIVQESQKELEKNKISNNARNQTQAPSRFTPVNSPANRLLGRSQPQPQQPAVNESQITSLSDAERGMIRGKVLIIADERANKLVIVTDPENMKPFDNVISELDIETTPDTVVKVYRLKYAEAEEVADMINDLIGNAAASKSSSKGSQNANSKNATVSKSRTTANKSVNQRTGDAKAGELSKDNTTVLADKRINGLVVMTEKDLVKTIETIIESMDVKLSQVLIETVIVEVGLDDTIKTGVDWISGLKSANQALAGGGGLNPTPRVGSELATDAIAMVPGGQGIGYFAHLKDLDLSMVISASKSDTHSKYLASPVIMTVDNKEATIDATTKQQFITGWQAVSSSYAGSGLPSPTYASTDIGLKVKVTPKINPNGTVMLEVEEEYTQVAGKQEMLVPDTSSGSGSSYSSQQVDIPTTRKMTSDVLLENMQTIVFGGLIESKEGETDAGIPILKDIPWIGKWLFGKVEISEKRTELLVFMTPYVMDDGQAAQAEAARRKTSLSDPRPWDDHGWSASKLADPVSAKEQLRKQKSEWKKQDEEHAAEREIERSREERLQVLIERMREETEEDAKRKQEQGE